ncbi:hypothetical protein BGZ91_000693 [Linnemannia elongata]|nr:hypothetical protein BGZ91_000693 [Linnemannia elongata]KAG0066104.1 hypothetical protein BGZ90_001542 [Linnemannia elongata]
MSFCYLEYQHTPWHRATVKGYSDSKMCDLFLYAGGGFRWTKVDVSVQIGTLLFKKTINLGTEWTFSLTLNENLEDAITSINVQFGDYTFKKGKLTIGKGTPESRHSLKQRMERNADMGIKYDIDDGEGCCIIL